MPHNLLTLARQARTWGEGVIGGGEDKGTYTRAAHTSLGMSLVLLTSARHRMTMFLLHENLIRMRDTCSVRAHTQHTDDT